MVLKIITFKNIIALAIRVLYFITPFFITLGGIIISLVMTLCHLVKPLIKKFSGLITCRGKPRFVLKRRNSDLLVQRVFIENLCIDLLQTIFYEKTLVQNSMINRLAYGVQIHSIYASSFAIQKNIASKKQVEKYFLNKMNVVKPFSIKKYVVSRSFVLLKLRRKCNGFSSYVFSSGLFCKTRILARKFSAKVELESECLKRSILEDLIRGKWPTDCIIKRKAITDYVQNVQDQILICKKEQQLELIAFYVFDIRNRIFAIDAVFNESKSKSYGQVGYSDLTLKVHKFILLEQTKLSNLSELPPCKIVMVETPKTNAGKESLGISMPIDKVLQCMFLNFLDVLVEEHLKPEVFAYRKGRDRRMAVASVYAKVNRAKYLEQMCLCSVKINKCFDNILHQQIIEQYPFPEKYSFLMSRWLTPTIVDKSQDFKKLRKISRGISQDSIIGFSIVNFLLSNAFPKNIQKEKCRKKAWAELFSYSDDIILIANDTQTFNIQLASLKKNLKKIGLSLNYKETKSFVNISSKVQFQFLGFEFRVMLREQLKKSSLFSNIKNSSKGFAIILRPSPEKVKDIKKRLKIVIRQILHQPRNLIYKSFQQINLTLLSWGSYYYFNQGCTIVKGIDNFVFKYLRKVLVKKFRYNGLLRPKWVAYNFLGLSKVNPNGNAWQPRALQYVRNSFKVATYSYVWFCGNIFSRLSITSFLLNAKLRKKNYYLCRVDFKKNMAKLISKRLKSDLKVKLYKEQDGLCLVCAKHMDEILLLSRSSKLHIHDLVPFSISKKIGLPTKFYESRNNKVLLHEKCHLVLHKNILFQNSSFLRTSVPKKPVVE